MYISFFYSQWRRAVISFLEKMQTLKPLSIIYNQKSGFHATHKEDWYEKIMTIFTAHGFEIQVFELSEKQPLAEVIKEVIARHQQHQDIGIVVSAGGDGTLNGIAQHLLGTHIPLGVLPLGTFNYVARLLKIPLDLLQAAEAIATGKKRTLHVAKVNEFIYLNNASLGLYPLFIQKREQYNKQLGRFQLHAYTSALEVLLRHYQELKLEIEIDGQHHPVSTPLLFFGNNQLQLKEMKLRISKAVKAGKIGGVMVAKTNQWSLIKLLIQLIKGKIEQAPEVYSFSADQVVVKTCKGQTIHLAIDGELVQTRSPLHFSVEKNALTMMVPHAITSL